MKKIALVFILLLDLFYVSGQNLTIKNTRAVRSFIECINSNDKERISRKVSFPLIREYPLPSIKNREEFIKRFNEVFDNHLLKIIISSRTKPDWSEMGWRGIMLLDGVIWLDNDGSLIAVNYKSLLEKEKRDKMVAEERNKLYESLKKFSSPTCILETSTYRIRIDEMGNSRYRFASWKLQQGMNDKPEVVLLNGKVRFDGSGGNHSYLFKSGDYIYECGIIEMGEDGTPPAFLIVTKGGKEILNQDARISK